MNQMSQKFIRFSLLSATIIALSLLSTSQFAHAKGGSGSEESYMLSTAAGISAPSIDSSLFENPAGLAYSSNSMLLFEADSGNSSLSPLGFGAGFFSGNGSVGGGFELQNAPGNTLVFTLGLAAEIPSVDMSLGLSATETGGGWGENLGLIFKPHGKVRIGAMAYGLFNGINAIGAGIAGDPIESATFAFDGAYDIQGKSTIVKPGMLIRLPAFQLGAGYGFRVQGNAGAGIRTGFSLALGIPINKMFAIQAYYNELNLYYAGLTISL